MLRGEMKAKSTFTPKVLEILDLAPHKPRRTGYRQDFPVPLRIAPLQNGSAPTPGALQRTKA